MTIAEDRVAAGAALLDEKLPGWHDQIDTETLEMGDECRCVLGQLGSNQVNLDRLGWEPSPRIHADEEEDGFSRLCDFWEISASNYGCDIYWDHAIDDAVASYDELKDAWLVEIAKRRAA